MSKVYKWVKIDVCKATDRCVRHPYEVGCIFDLFGVPYFLRVTKMANLRDPQNYPL